jgi:hypothetical protein
VDRRLRIVVLACALGAFAVLVVVVWSSGSRAGSASSSKDLKGDLRVAIPSVTAYYSDHGNYTDMTIDDLRFIDPRLPTDVAIGSASAEAYCLEATDGIRTMSVLGPKTTWVDGPC